MVASLPPQYRRLSSSQGQVPQSGSDLPPYSRRNPSRQTDHTRQPTEHIFQSADGKSKPWIILRVFSSAKTPKSLPTFFEKENIVGRLEIDAEKGDSIQAITATVTGRILTGSTADDAFVFLSQVLPIWSKSSESPRVPSLSEGAASSKLVGHCVWPLSVSLARTVVIPSASGEMRSYRLPETFLERHTRVSVQYDLTVVVSRGRLRADNRVQTAFGYVPINRPGLPSLLRQLAYQQFLPLPGPFSDPEGWKTLRPVTVRGTMFRSQRVEAKCTLSIAKPLSYTRGTVLPCFLTLESSDSMVLDLLSVPGSIVLSLKRRVRFYDNASSARRDVAWNENVENAGTAVWWPSNDAINNDSTRHFEGEIRLAKDLRPTSTMGHFSISYAVVLGPFVAVGFSSDSEALLSEPVEIATMHAKGPRTNTYSPPDYDYHPRPRSIPAMEYMLPIGSH